MSKLMKDVYDPESPFRIIEEQPEFLRKHVSEFLQHTGAYKKQIVSLFELFQQGAGTQFEKKA